MNTLQDALQLNPISASKNAWAKQIIVDNTKLLDDLNPRFSTRYWFLKNGLTEVKRCPCGKPALFDVTYTHKVFRKFCSAECQSQDKYAQNQRRVGIKSFFRDEDLVRVWAEKRENTCMERFGHTNPSYVQEFKDKISIAAKSKSDLEKAQIHEKRKATNLLRFGEEHPMLVESFAAAASANRTQTLLKDYGTTSISALPHIAKKREATLMRKFGVTNAGFIKNKVSKQELILRDIIKDNGATFTTQNRKLAGGKEIDIVIPSHSVAFEVNGVFYHNEYHKSVTEHKMKVDKCLEHNIILYHIYDVDIQLRKRRVIVNNIVNAILSASDELDMSLMKNNESYLEHRISCDLRSEPKYDRVISIECQGHISTAFISGDSIVRLIGFNSMMNVVLLDMCNDSGVRSLWIDLRYDGHLVNVAKSFFPNTTDAGIGYDMVQRGRYIERKEYNVVTGITDSVEPIDNSALGYRIFDAGNIIMHK